MSMSDSENKIVLMGVVEDILNDDELVNLRVKDIRRVIIHLQLRLSESDEDDSDSQEDAKKYVL